MKRSYTIEAAGIETFDEIMELWQASVLATHHFLNERDFLIIKEALRNEFLYNLQIYIIRNDLKEIDAFAGIVADKLEMLFVRPSAMGKGMGKALLRYAISTKGILFVDVNEENKKAVLFYQSQGFEIVGRSEKDSLGLDYPLLHLRRKNA